MLEVAARVVFDVFCGITGHSVLWALTLGRWKPLNNRDDVATLVGILFWVVIGVGIWLLFFR